MKSSVEQCTGTIDLMRSELDELKSMTSEGMSKMRTRHEKDKITILELEKKLEGANNLIRRIRPSGGMRGMIDETSSTASRWNTPHEPQMPRRFETSFTPYDASEKKRRNSNADSQPKHNPHIQQSISPLQLKTSISNAISKQATAFDSKFTIISNI